MSLLTCVQKARTTDHRGGWAWWEPRGTYVSMMLEGICPLCAARMERLERYGYCPHCDLSWTMKSPSRQPSLRDDYLFCVVRRGPHNRGRYAEVRDDDGVPG